MALAKHYATLGATLGLIARNKESLEALAKELPGAFFYDVDVRNAQSMQSATLAIPTKLPCPDARIATINGWKVLTIPVTLVAKIDSKTSLSSAYSVRVPRLIPALAMTMSGQP